MAWTSDWSPNSTFPQADGKNQDGNRGGGGTLIASATFDGGVLDAGWSEVDADNLLSFAASNATAVYPSSVGDNFSPTINTAAVIGLNEVFVKLQASKTSGGGSKFVKIHGQEQDIDHKLRKRNVRNAVRNRNYSPNLIWGWLRCW